MSNAIERERGSTTRCAFSPVNKTMKLYRARGVGRWRRWLARAAGWPCRRNNLPKIVIILTRPRWQPRPPAVGSYVNYVVCLRHGRLWFVDCCEERVCCAGKHRRSIGASEREKKTRDTVVTKVPSMCLHNQSWRAWTFRLGDDMKTPLIWYYGIFSLLLSAALTCYCRS